MDAPIRLIEEIIERFGPRAAGSEAEREAQYFFKERLEKFCDHVEIHVFKESLGAKFGSLKIFCLIYVLTLALVSVSYPLAVIFAWLNAILFVGHFVIYRNWLDFLFPKKSSLNVTGTIEPVETVTSTLIFAGHMDSTPEFIWWYWLKDWGIRLNILSSLAFVTLPITLSVLAFFNNSLFQQVVWWTYIAILPATLSFFFIHGKRIVDGAQDNLSGISVAEFTGRNLVKDGVPRLQHTRIKIVAFGSEETGLKGSDAYVKRYEEQLKEEHASLVNLDGILDVDEIHLIERELSPMVHHDARLVQGLQQVLEDHGLKANRCVLPVGATDAASFSKRCIPAVSIVALPMKRLHPTYHTRLDTVEHLSADTLQSVSDAMVDFAIAWDRSGNN